ncbi:hypothetical protein B4122_0062 [Bacillus subtilis]|uniref:Uncharacterized protein n=1 Tax=Bacillus subtilis TaxID=1423 RepID=A0AAP1HCB3_BACIU|nr:hypothetical protein B4122_0062 [Bacillus subtilis]
MISPLFDPLIWNSVKRYNNFSNLRSVNFYKSAFKTVQKNMVISTSFFVIPYIPGKG